MGGEITSLQATCCVRGAVERESGGLAQEVEVMDLLESLITTIRLAVVQGL